MKNYIIIFALTLGACVQKTKKQEVTLILNVFGMKDINTVAVRGDDKPLSWKEDYLLQEVVKDSLYRGTFGGETGLLGTKIKFVVNGTFELENKPNRYIVFDRSGKTTYTATFNK